MNTELLTQSGTAHADSHAKKGLRAGRVISALAVLFLLFDALIKVMKAPFAVEATIQLGFPASAVFGIGAVLRACTLLYAIPPTSILGARSCSQAISAARSPPARPHFTE